MNAKNMNEDRNKQAPQNPENFFRPTTVLHTKTNPTASYLSTDVWQSKTIMRSNKTNLLNDKLKFNGSVVCFARSLCLMSDNNSLLIVILTYLFRFIFVCKVVIGAFKSLEFVAPVHLNCYFFVHTFSTCAYDFCSFGLTAIVKADLVIGQNVS